MRLLSRIGVAAAACALVAFMPASAEAAIMLSPGVADCSADFGVYSGANAETNFLVTECGATAPLTLLYKNENPTEEGTFADSYNTQYFNTPQDPEDATISYVAGQPVINCLDFDCWLVVKDGNVDPSDYGFDITGWDGLMDIVMTDFFIGTGAISHVSIWSGPGGGGDGPAEGPGDGPGEGPVPEPATLALLGMGLVAAGARLRRPRA